MKSARRPAFCSTSLDTTSTDKLARKSTRHCPLSPVCFALPLQFRLSCLTKVFVSGAAWFARFTATLVLVRQDSLVFGVHDIPWYSMIFHDIPWYSMKSCDLLLSLMFLWPHVIPCAFPSFSASTELVLVRAMCHTAVRAPHDLISPGRSLAWNRHTSSSSSRRHPLVPQII